MNEQSALPIYESEEDALRDAVLHAGGFKSIGATLWPDMSGDAAGRKLADCLNADRSHTLRYGQISFIIKRAHDAGYHAPFQWWAQQCGYEAKVIEPAAQVDRAIETVATATRALELAVRHLSKLQSPAVQIVADRKVA